MQDGIVSTVAGNGTSGFVNGVDSLAEFKSPRGIVEDALGNHLFICDNGNHVIRKIWLSVSTNISMVEEGKHVNIYPNPAHNKITIAFNSAITPSINDLTLSDLTGRLILKKSFPAAVVDNKVDIDVSGVTSGVYVVTVNNGEKEIAHGKIIIE